MRIKTQVQNIDENGDPADPTWIDTNYTYDTLDNMATKEETISSTLTATTTYSRDSNENLTTVTHPENNQSYTSYDERDLVYQSAVGYGSANPVTATNYYDLNGNLIETRIGDGSKGTVYYEYDGFDRRNKVTDKLGNYTVTEYDDNSNVHRVARYSPAPESLLLSEVYYDYDELNRMYKITAKKFDTPGGTGNPADVITTFWYDKKGRKWKTEVTRNYQTIATTTDYDNLDRVTRVTDPIGNKVEYTDYDGNGNPWTITETEKHGESEDVFVTTNVYDNLDRLTSSTNVLGTMEYKYDSRNNNKYTTDRENHITRREYDLMNRLNENIYQLATGDISVKYGLDKNGRLVSQTDDNGNTTTYGYDDVNRRISETMPDNNSHKSYFFNQYGALDGMIDNNESGISYTYNAGLQMTQKDINKGTGVEGVIKETFTYDGIGRMKEAVNYITETASSTVAMDYDSLGNVLKETQNGKEVESTYDVLSFRTQLEYPSGNKTINFVPDYLNRIESITQNSQPIAQYYYAGPGRVTSRVYNNGNSPTLNIEYDGGRRATSYIHSYSSTTITGFAYHFDNMNNKLYEHRWTENKGDAFKYDEIYRLTGVKYEVTNLNPSTVYADYTGNPEETYDLDGVGNRLEVANGTITTTYSANELNQYDVISGTSLFYDDNGNMLGNSVITCTYNYANQLIKVIRSSDEQVLGEYKYDCLGRRIYKWAWNEDTQSATETCYYYDGARCIEEQTTGGTTIATYVFGNGVDEVLTMDRNSETYYYHENSLGSIYAVTTGTGTVAERYTYDAYGNVTFLDANGNSIVSSTIGNRILFTSREFDSETGLYYYRTRYYSSEQGRFINRDPLGYFDSMNLYEYVRGNPTNFSDPFGLEAKGNPDKAKELQEKSLKKAIGKDESGYYSSLTNNKIFGEMGIIYETLSTEENGKKCHKRTVKKEFNWLSELNPDKDEITMEYEYYVVGNPYWKLDYTVEHQVVKGALINAEGAIGTYGVAVYSTDDYVKFTHYRCFDIGARLIITSKKLGKKVIDAGIVKSGVPVDEPATIYRALIHRRFVELVAGGVNIPQLTDADLPSLEELKTNKYKRYEQKDLDAAIIRHPPGGRENTDPMDSPFPIKEK